MKETYILIILILLIYSAYTDIKKKEIMMIPVYMCFLIGIFGMIMPSKGETASVIGIVPGACILLVSMITKEAVGSGDAYLFMTIGFLTGIKTAAGSIILSSIAAGLYSVLIICMRKGRRNDTIPYAPFILTGYIGAIAFG